MGDSLSLLWYSGCGFSKVRPRFQGLWRAAIKREAKGASKLHTIKTRDHKETDGARLPVYTTSLNCWAIKHTHTGILTITHISMTQTRELGNVKRKSRMLVSVNGMSGAIVKCSNVSFNVFFSCHCSDSV